MIPAPAQGTLALELRADNAKLMAKLDALSDEKTNLCAGIEREFLKRIGGNCHLPVAAYCDIVSEKDRGNDSNKNNRLKLLAMFGSEDGKSLQGQSRYGILHQTETILWSVRCTIFGIN